MVSNHENHDLLDSLPVTEWHGGRVHQISSHIIHLMRGEIYDIGGYKFFTFGGAESTDKGSRKEGLTWWSREVSNLDERKRAWDNIDKNDYKVDFIITHAAPTWIQSSISAFDKPNVQTHFFDDVDENVGFCHWFCGHYHQDLSIADDNGGKQYTVTYNYVYEIKDGEAELVCAPTHYDTIIHSLDE